MWLIVDDRMADDRRIRRLPLAAVGLWIKLCAYHNFNLGDAEYDGWFDMFDVKSYGGTKRTFDQLLDAGLFEPFGNGWRPVYHEGVCKPPKLLTDEQRKARAEAGRKGGKAGRKPGGREADGEQTASEPTSENEADSKQVASVPLSKREANSKQVASVPLSKREANSKQVASVPLSKREAKGKQTGSERKAKTKHKTYTYTNIPIPTLPTADGKQPACPDAGPDTGPGSDVEADAAFRAAWAAYPSHAGGPAGRTRAQTRFDAITDGQPAQTARLQSAIRRYARAVNDGHIPRRQVPRMSRWLDEQWADWAPEPIPTPKTHQCTPSCEHVMAILGPHENEYDHTGRPSPWLAARQECADQLNQNQRKETQP
ncbi:hypothetical protein [Bifidobacterium dentium]|uniref:hypothetical protein n=1 Tax=Bifidobacterium dentium TaxID=1689 RepID=UPI0018B075FF|nr:hypothetical protein [Bifidobacterium dentium]MBF9690626.1 hypothetical protein [Bifidobacterium dentium]